MKIEIYADNLKPTDVKYNQLIYSLSLIIVKDNLVFILYRDTDMIYHFPKIGYSREFDQPLAIKSITDQYGFDETLLVKSVSIYEHFPKRTYVNHYFKFILANDASLSLNQEHEEKQLWLSCSDALMALEQYEGDDRYGAQKTEKEFIALFNSL